MLQVWINSGEIFLTSVVELILSFLCMLALIVKGLGNKRNWEST